MCVYYRVLIAKTVKDRYPLPRVDEHLDRLEGCKYFTSLKKKCQCHQVDVSIQLCIVLILFLSIYAVSLVVLNYLA